MSDTAYYDSANS